MRKYGYCPDCGFAVRLGAGNRVLGHNRLSPRGKILGPCSGRGKRAKPSNQKLALHIKIHAPRPRKRRCRCCGQILLDQVDP